MLRILLGVNLLCADGQRRWCKAHGVADWPQQYVEMAAWVQPLLLLSNLALLALLRNVPSCRLSCACVSGSTWVVLLAAAVAVLLLDFWRFHGLRRRWLAAQLTKAGMLGGLAAANNAVLFRDARQDLLAGLDRGAPAGADRAHPAAFPVQQPECRALADPLRPAPGGTQRWKSWPICSGC
jgi:hypothetical protein